MMRSTLMTTSCRDMTGNLSQAGGVCFYYKSNICCKHEDDFDMCDPYIECMILHRKITNTHPIYYYLIYRPPTGNIMKFLDKLEYLCLELCIRTATASVWMSGVVLK